MEAHELHRPDGPSRDEYVLGIRLSPATSQDLAQEFRDIKGAVLKWSSKRGESGIMVMFTIVADPDVHEVFDELLAKIYMRESELAPVLQQRMIQVNLLDLEGNECGQYEVLPPGQGA
jgi:hypothetical protein